MNTIFINSTNKFWESQPVSSFIKNFNKATHNKIINLSFMKKASSNLLKNQSSGRKVQNCYQTIIKIMN